jgi:hypothetical protein
VVRFDDEAWNEDRSHATPAGRAVAGSDRPRLEAKGIGVDELKACESEGRDGTRLAGCVKSYRPQPDGRWGLVLRLVRFEGELGLLCVAFGVRHPERAWQPSVYQVAHRRLHPQGD